jgi:hypothetical protein
VATAPIGSTIAADRHHDRVHLSGRSDADREARIRLRLAPAAEGWTTVELPSTRDGVLHASEIVGCSGRRTREDTKDPLTAEILRLFKLQPVEAAKS